MLIHKTDKTWFSCLVRHPARKRSGSILTTRSPNGAHDESKIHICIEPNVRFYRVVYMPRGDSRFLVTKGEQQY